MTRYVLDARTATPHFPGIGRYVTSLAAALAPLLASDERLTVLYHPDHRPALSQFAAVTLVPVAISPFALAQQWQIPRLLHQMRADVYHSSYNLMPYAPGVPTILTVYDLIPLLMPEQSRGRARLLARWANALALRAARVALAISETTRRDYLLHFRVPSERIITVPLAADPVFRPPPEDIVAALRARYALPERYALYLGSNKPHKNLVRLVEAWQTGHVSRLVIAGAWDDRYPEAKQRVAALGLDDSVVFLGPVGEADLPALYAGAELFVFPSLFEGFGFPVLEAMACGTPVICSNVSSLPEAAGTAALQVDPRNTDALSAAIDRVLGDAALRRSLRQQGLAQAGRFSWTRTAQQTLAAYRRALNKAN
jgi:glycosyltransferase involved in cell wall biosynthesis